ncbi:unnamed protein product [Amoebophrya sp. A25]|nr:unnamed protein product [Amoebophrya sp. A25]|eukprot:GSA25T00010116001.1
MPSVKQNPNGGRPLITIEPDGNHTATLFFFHGLGDSSLGWKEPLEQIAQQTPGLKIIAPTAPTIPVTISGGAKQTAWCDLAAASFNPMDVLTMLQKRPPMVESSWVEVLRLVTTELTEHPNVPLGRILFGGFSLGAHIAAWTALQLPQKCAGVLLMSGIILGVPSLCLNKTVCEDLPVLHCHGTADMVVPFMGAQMVCQQLKEGGVSKYELKSYEGMAHTASPEELADVIAFVKNCMTASAATPGSGQAPTLTICSNGLEIPNGTSVVITSLKSKPHLNGKIGIITGFTPRKARYTVLIEEESLMLAPASFRIESVALEDGGSAALSADGESFVEVSTGAPLSSDKRFKTGAIVRLKGLKAGAPWNGSVARLEAWNESTGRYTLDLGNNAQLQIKAENFTL